MGIVLRGEEKGALRVRCLTLSRAIATAVLNLGMLVLLNEGDGGFNWNWLGLIGLAGLAGLARKSSESRVD